MIFQNREDAGRNLVKALQEYQKRKGVIVLGLARGGMILAAVIAKMLEIPFDVIITQKIGAPTNPELAIGAITEKGKGYFNQRLIELLHVSKTYIDQTVAIKKKEAERRLTLYRHNRPIPSLRDITVIIVDDGIATGATMMAALLAIRSEHPKKIIVAVPVAAPESLNFLSPFADQIICLYSPDDFMSVGEFYESFPQTDDSEIIQLFQEE